MQDARARIISATLMRKSHYNDIAECVTNTSSPPVVTEILLQARIHQFLLQKRSLRYFLDSCSAIEKLELIDARRFNTEL
jgi:hypothetical protein